MQVILQPLVTVEEDGELAEAPAFSDGPVYRLALSYDCEAQLPEHLLHLPGHDSGLLQFSDLAVIDFELLDLSSAEDSNHVWKVRSALLPLDIELDEDKSAQRIPQERTMQMERFDSHSCPRFVPSQRGSRLLFATQFDSLSVKQDSGLSMVHERRLAITRIPGGSVTKSEDFEAPWLDSISSMPRGDESKARMLECAVGTLPCAPVHGCPEFVPSLYLAPESITDTITDKVKELEQQIATPGRVEDGYAAKLTEWKKRDTFVYTSNTLGSATVLDVDAQVLAVSLPNENLDAIHKVSAVRNLYNVESRPAGTQPGGVLLPEAKDSKTILQLEGCQPIRAAGRKGHMRLEWAFETLLMTLSVANGKRGYATWLACLTADQRVAIVASPREKLWTNMSMPNPVWLEDASMQNVWCPPERVEGCFEVWSSPNPNEVAG